MLQNGIISSFSFKNTELTTFSRALLFYQEGRKVFTHSNGIL